MAASWGDGDAGVAKSHQTSLLDDKTSWQQPGNSLEHPTALNTLDVAVPRRPCSRPAQPPPRPMAAWPRLHKGKNTPMASSSTSAPTMASKIGSIEAARPLML